MPESKETPKMEAKAHPKSFLQKAVMKAGAKGKALGKKSSKV